MEKTKVYETTLDYIGIKGGKEESSKVHVIGADGFVLTWTRCHGKTYSSIKKVKPLKTKSFDEVMEKAVRESAEKIDSWLPWKTNGQELFKHWSTNYGEERISWFEMNVLENYDEFIDEEELAYINR